LEEFASFRIFKLKESGKYRLEYQIEYPLNLQLGKNTNCKLWRAEKDELFIKRISSLLFMEKEYIKVLLKVFWRSINDLIMNGAEQKINLGFCLIKMRKNLISCKFSKKIIESIE